MTRSGDAQYNRNVTLRERVASVLLRQRSPRASPIIVPDWETALPQHSDWDTTAAIRDGYRAHIAVYRCVTELSGAVATVPWVLRRERSDGGTEEAPYTHPGWQLLRKANPRMSWSQLVEGAAVCILLAGNHYCLTVSSGQRVELYRLRPDRVTVIPGRDGAKAYQYRVGSEEMVYPAEEIIHHLFYDPGSDYYGLSPLRAAARTVDTDNAMVDWNRYSMRNRARPDGIVSVKAPLSDQQHAALVKQIDEQRSGSANARRVIVVSGAEASFVPMSLTPVELDFVASHQMSSRDVCTSYGVHPEALGLAEATYENKRWAIRAMWEGPILRLLKCLRDGFNLRLQDIWGEDVFIDFDLSETPAVIGARRDKAEEARIYWGLGVPFNQLNIELGLGFQQVPGGNVGYLPMSYFPVGGGSASRGNVNGDEIRSYTTDAQLDTYWRAVDRPKIAWEAKVADLVKQRFSAERAEAVSYVQNGGRDLDPLIDALARGWTETMTASWQAIVEYFGNDVLHELYPERAVATIQTRQDLWNSVVAEYVARVVARRVTMITDSTKAALRDEIAAGIAENEGTAQIARRIQRTYGEWMGEGEVPFDRSRSYTIARTEVHGAASYGMHQGAAQSGAFSKKRWLTTRDGRERDSHAMMDGQERALDERYSNGLMYPGDPDGEPGETVNCRCTETYS